MSAFASERDEALARAAEHRRWLAYFAAMIVCSLGFLLAGLGSSLGRGQLSEPYRAALGWMIGGGLGAIVIGGLAMFLSRPNANSRLLLGMAGARDRAQTKRAEQIVLPPAANLYMTSMGAKGVWAIFGGTAEREDWILVACSVLLSVFFLAMLAGLDNLGDRRMKRLLDDELVRSIRSRSLMLAFPVLLAGFIGVFVLALWQPQAAIALMPLVLGLSAVAGSIRYALLDHAADANG